MTLWTVACQAPLSMVFPRHEYWSGLPCSSPGDFPNSALEPTSLMFPALAVGFFTTSATWEALEIERKIQCSIRAWRTDFDQWMKERKAQAWFVYENW